MTGPIDPIGRVGRINRVRRVSGARVEASDAPHHSSNRNLPVPIVGAEEADPPPPPVSRAPTAAVFAAQLLGQDGQKRGLRGGPATLDTAKASYVRTEWSGQADRRSRTGRATKTEI